MRMQFLLLCEAFARASKCAALSRARTADAARNLLFKGWGPRLSVNFIVKVLGKGMWYYLSLITIYNPSARNEGEIFDSRVSRIVNKKDR